MQTNPADDNVTQWVFGLNGQTATPVERGPNPKSSPKRKKRDKSPPKEPKTETTLPPKDVYSGTLVMAYTNEKDVNHGKEYEPDPQSRTRVTATEFDLADFQPHPMSFPTEDGDDVYDGPKKSAVGHQARPSFLKSSWGKEVLAEYVTRNILQAECNYYVKNPSSRGASCKCGRTSEWHRQRGCVYNENNEAEQWNPRNYTEKLPCDSFGEICFQGFGNETKNSPYLRLDCATDLDKVWTVLTECWCLPYPTLIISVIGCSGRLEVKPRLKGVFKQGLVNAVASTGAWLITDGTHTGVVQLVGQAVQDYHLMAGASERADIVALGIADWGTVTNKEALEGDLDNGMFPAYYSIEAVTDSRRSASLDHNHTHFLLVDDGTEKRPGHAPDFRVALESYISGRVETGIAQEHSVSVPAVLLLVGGDRDSLLTVLAYVRRRTPVVVIQGTGSTADILATAYKLSRNPQNEESSAYPAGFLATCMRNIQEQFHGPDTDDMAVFREAKESMRIVMEILQHRQMLSVFQLDDAAEADIDKCILYALLKANKHRPETQLALTLAWNRSDVAREKIFTYENRKKWQKVNLYDAMFTALVQDRVHFIQLFIDSGVDLKRLTVSTLWNLYAHVMNDPPDNCAELLKGLVSFYQQETSVCCGPSEKGETSEDLLKKIGRLLRDLLGEQFMNLYKGPRFLLSKALSSQPWGQEESFYDPNSKTSPWDKKKKRRVRQDFENPERELFIWSLLLNRKDMAKFFWRIGKDHIGGAMVACTLLKSLSAMAEDEEEAELSESLLEHASYYENVAEAVLSETYNRNKRMAHALLVRELTTWGDTTLFVLAQNGELMEIMDHACCQTKLNLIWNGCIAQHTPVWKVILTILCPVFIPMIKFADNETLKEVTDEDSNEEDIRPPALNRVTPEGLSDVRFTQSRTRLSKPRKKKRSFFQVNCCNEDSGLSGVNINFCNAIYYFYTAPVTKFYCSAIAYMIFLCLFTYFVLTDLHPMVDATSVSVSEWVTWGWAFTMFIEEFRQIFARTPKVMKYKLISWGRSFWNRYDMTMYLLFTLAIVLRCTLTHDQFAWARMSYSITLTMFYLRFMQTFYAEKNIGPKVIMIKLMLTDLVFFLLILLVFVASFGTAYHANLYPNTRLSWDILKNVIYIPYWQTYGLFNLEVIEGNLDGGSCLGNSSVVGLDTCPEQTWLVPVLTAIYVLLTHILLVNLLIAMFSYTFSRVQKNSEKVWSYYRFSIIFEYYDRPAFVAPLSLLVYVYRLFRHCCQGGMRQSTAFRRLLKRDDYERYTSLERSSTEKILTRAIIEQREGLDSKVTSAADRLERVMAELENIKEQIEEPKDAGTIVHADPDNYNRSRSSGPESDDLVNYRLKEMQQQLTTVLSMLTKHS